MSQNLSPAAVVIGALRVNKWVIKERTIILEKLLVETFKTRNALYAKIMFLQTTCTAKIAVICRLGRSSLQFRAKNINATLKSRTITALDKQKYHRKIVNIFLAINFNICFWCSKAPSR